MSEEEQKEVSIVELLTFVRKHQVYKGDVIKVNPLAYQSISDWLEDQQITQGQFPIRGAAFYDLYFSWCQTKSLAHSSIAKRRKFHATLLTQFGGAKNSKHRNTFYYINKKVAYEPQKNKDQAGSKRAQKIKSEEKI